MGMSNLWKKFEDEIVHEGTFAQKTSNFVCAPCGRYQDIRHLFLNPKLSRNGMGFKNHNLYHKTLKHWALEQTYLR